MKKIFSTKPILQNECLLLARLTMGWFLTYHGWEVFDAAKMQEYMAWDSFKQSASAGFMIYLGKGSELVAGLLLFVGLFTRLAAIIIMATLSYIAFFVGHGKIWYEDQHPFMFVLLGIIFLFIGPGKWSLDYLLSRPK